MAAKTQDAAGETGVPCSHPYGYNAMGCCFTCGAKIAQSISEYGGIAATPREPAIAAPTGETVCSHGCVQDECEVCAEFDIKMGEAVMGCLALRENAEDWMPATLRKHADALNELLQQMRALHVRDIAAARVPAPSAPQEPRGEAGEGMVERERETRNEVLAYLIEGSDPDSWDALDAYRDAVRVAALSTGGRDAS